MTIADVLNANPRLQRRLFFLARRFVAGETLADAVDAVRELNGHGLSASLDFLGEDVSSTEEAATNTAVYCDMIERIVAERLDSNVSVKLSAIGQMIDEELAVRNLQRIVDSARACDMFIRLDMEGSATVDSTYRIMDRARATYPHIGAVIQAYLHRAGPDARRLLENGVRMRLVKGAYKEPPAVALQHMSDIRRNFMTIAEKLLASPVYCGMATHDEFLIDAIRAFVERNGIGADRFEFQMLYGIRREAQRALVREGYRMRVYVPFGTHWAGYFYRRLAERRENVMFVLRNLWRR